MNATAPALARDLRTRILDEATRLFAEQGYSATSIRQVVQAVHCTKPAVYYYFRNKEDLFRQVVQQHVDALSALIASYVSRPGPIRPRMHEALMTFVEHAQRNPHAMRLLQSVEMAPEEDAPDIDVSTARRLHFQMMEDLIGQGMRTGEIRSDVDPRDCAIALAGTINFQFQLWLHCGEEWSPPRLHRTVDILFDGIGIR
jgi:AcrR family transcriptional regulator